MSGDIVYNIAQKFRKQSAIIITIKTVKMPLTQYPEWESYSRKLSKEEVEHPELVLDELFDYAHLPDVRELLWLWLKTTVNGDFAEGLDHQERVSILFFYEKIERLVEAAHILHMRSKKSPPVDQP
jgi:hypothetical protein